MKLSSNMTSCQQWLSPSLSYDLIGRGAGTGPPNWPTSLEVADWAALTGQPQDGPETGVAGREKWPA